MTEAELRARLIEIRLRAGLTRKDAAARVNLSLASLSNYENGFRRMPLDVLYSLLDVYGATMYELVTGWPQDGETDAAFRAVYALPHARRVPAIAAIEWVLDGANAALVTRLRKSARLQRLVATADDATLNMLETTMRLDPRILALAVQLSKLPETERDARVEHLEWLITAEPEPEVEVPPMPEEWQWEAFCAS